MIHNNFGTSSAFDPAPGTETTRRRTPPPKPEKPAGLTSAASEASEPALPPRATPVPTSATPELAPPAGTVRPATPKPVAEAAVNADAAGQTAPAPATDTAAQSAADAAPEAAETSPFKAKLRAAWLAVLTHAMAFRAWSKRPLNRETFADTWNNIKSFANTVTSTVQYHWQNPNVRAAVYGAAATGLSIAAIVGITVASGGMLLAPALALAASVPFGFAAMRAFFRGRQDAKAASES